MIVEPFAPLDLSQISSRSEMPSRMEDIVSSKIYKKKANFFSKLKYFFVSGFQQLLETHAATSKNDNAGKYLYFFYSFIHKS